jgi:hypothetical protein
MRNTALILAAVIVSVFLLGACQQPSPAANAGNSAVASNAVENGKVPQNQGECSQGGGEPAVALNSPLEAYNFLFDAVHRKDVDAIKQVSSEATRQLAQVSANTFKKSCYDAYKNGFTESSMQDTMPETRDVRQDGDVAAMEIKKKDGTWEDVPFVKEGNGWKLAQGDLFFGRIKSPGKSQSQLEQENANARGVNTIMVNPMANKGNANVFKAVPVPDEKVDKPLLKNRPGQPQQQPNQ